MRSHWLRVGTVRMCRVVAYLGESIMIDFLLYASDRSLCGKRTVERCWRCILADCGVAAGACLSIRPTCLACTERQHCHVRQEPEVPGGEDQARVRSRHVRGPRTSWADGRRSGQLKSSLPLRGFQRGAPHNGTLGRFGEMKFDLLDRHNLELPRLCRRFSNEDLDELLANTSNISAPPARPLPGGGSDRVLFRHRSRAMLVSSYAAVNTARSQSRAPAGSLVASPCSPPVLPRRRA